MFSPIRARAITPTPGPISLGITNDVAQLNHAIDSPKQGSTQKLETFAVAAPINADIEAAVNSDKEKATVALADLNGRLKRLDEWLIDAENFNPSNYKVEMKAFTAGYVALLAQVSTAADPSQKKFWDRIEEELEGIYKKFQECQTIAIGYIDEDDRRKKVVLERDSKKDSSFEDARAISAKPVSRQDYSPHIPQVSGQRTENLNVGAESAWLAAGIERLAELVKETGDAQMNAAFAHLLNTSNTHRNNISSNHQTSSRIGSQIIGARGRQRRILPSGYDADSSDSE